MFGFKFVSYFVVIGKEIRATPCMVRIKDLKRNESCIFHQVLCRCLVVLGGFLRAKHTL